MKKREKYILIYAIVVTVVAAIFVHNTVTLLETTTIEIKNECPALEDEIRGMTTDQTNKLMIVVAETLTDNYKEETREQVEKEHEAYANRLALDHMNDVMGVLIKSIGAMPTSTIEK